MHSEKKKVKQFLGSIREETGRGKSDVVVFMNVAARANTEAQRDHSLSL